MNTNDFSKCKIGDKLWSIQLGDCKIVHRDLPNQTYPISVEGNSRGCMYTKDGKFELTDKHQSLFFSNPNIIAPPEPPRMPDYKPGQWIAVWDKLPPNIRKFLRFVNGNSAICETHTRHEIFWPNHCTIEELPEVLAKWGEKK